MTTSLRFLLLFCLTTLLCSPIWQTNSAKAQVNSPTCDTFTNKTTNDGLGGNLVYGVYALGSTVYAATNNGLSISTDAGNTFINKTTTNGLGYNTVMGVYAVGSTVYAATGGGLSLCTQSPMPVRLIAFSASRWARLHPHRHPTLCRYELLPAGAGGSGRQPA